MISFVQKCRPDGTILAFFIFSLEGGENKCKKRSHHPSPPKWTHSSLVHTHACTSAGGIHCPQEDSAMKFLGPLSYFFFVVVVARKAAKYS
jgi:hypothetical protein